MTDEEVKKFPWSALEKYSDKLTPEQFDYCVRAWPSDALAYCADKLSEEQYDYCKEKTKLLMKNQKKQILCISCGNQERTIDDTGRCDSCRRELYERECWMCDFD